MPSSSSPSVLLGRTAAGSSRRCVNCSASVADTLALAITAYGTMFDRERAIRAGFDEYVVKPIERWELCRIVATLADRAGGPQKKLA